MRLNSGRWKVKRGGECVQEMNLKKWMVVKDLTVAEFAEKVGVSPQTVTNWRKGHTMPNSKYIPIIEQILGIKYQDITWTETS